MLAGTITILITWIYVLARGTCEMAPEYGLEEVEAPGITECLTALILAPVVLPVAAAVSNPLGREALKGGILVYEKVKEAIAQTEEIFADLAVEVKAELAEQSQPGFSFGAFDNFKDSQLPVAENVKRSATHLNEQVSQVTNGMADLRLLVPLGLSILAMRQLIYKGIQLDEIPWYTLAWYAFDSFGKLNDTGASEPIDQLSNIEIT